MASDLASKTCVPCRGGVPPLSMDVASRLMEQLDGWQFEQGHHPDVYMTWGKVSLEIWTHKIDGLTESDFILAAKFDEVPVPNQSRPAVRAGEDDSDEADDTTQEDDAAGGDDDFDDSDDSD